VSAVFAAGLILLAFAAATGIATTGSGWLRSVPYAIGAAGAACLAVVGGFAVDGRAVTLNISGWLGDPLPGRPTLGLGADRLSGLFLLLALGAAVPVSVAFADWAARAGGTATRMLACGYALALGSVTVIVTAQDAFTLLFGWEALTAAFYLLTGASRRDPDRVGAARVTVVFGKVSGAMLLIGLLLLAGKAHSISLASFAQVPDGAVRTTALVLLLTGFAIKAGLVPFQVWLPRGYAAAPGPARAIMAGVCVNVAFYGMWRTLALLPGRPPEWLAAIMLLLGGASALLGIAHAAVSSRLTRVIAYSSVENSGLIITGFGVALTGASVGNHQLVAIGLLAATLQLVAHAAAKSLLFTAAAGIEATGIEAAWRQPVRGEPPTEAGALPGYAASGNGSPAATRGARDDLERLRGAGRRAPWSGAGLAVGAVTLAGLPPTAGFVSEWFLLESLMQQFRVATLEGRLTLALAGAAVALTAGFAGVTFVRLVGMVVLGPPASRGGGLAGVSPAADIGGDTALQGDAQIARLRTDGNGRGVPAETRDPLDQRALAPFTGGEYRWPGRIGLAVLAACPLAFAAVTPLEIRVIAAGSSPAVPATLTLGALKSPWVLQPVFAGFSILSPSWLWVAMPVMLALVVLLTLALSGRRALHVRRVPAWRSATIGVEGESSYTAFGYANPTRRVLASVLHTQVEVASVLPAAFPAPAVGPATGNRLGDGVTSVDGGGVQARPANGVTADDAVPHLTYDSDVVEVVESWLYRPTARAFTAVVATAKRLQSGRLDSYLLYMLIALVAVVAVVTALA
jgi:hydrogenase-4 component B